MTLNPEIHKSKTGMFSRPIVVYMLLLFLTKTLTLYLI